MSASCNNFYAVLELSRSESWWCPLSISASDEEPMRSGPPDGNIGSVKENATSVIHWEYFSKRNIIQLCINHIHRALKVFSYSKKKKYFFILTTSKYSYHMCNLFLIGLLHCVCISFLFHVFIFGPFFWIWGIWIITLLKLWYFFADM